MKEVLVELLPCKHLMRIFRSFNRKFFNGRLPNRTPVYWNDWFYKKESTLGLFCSTPLEKFGPFSSYTEANAVRNVLNRDKKKGWDFIKTTSRGKRGLHRVPYICIASELDGYYKALRLTLLHEMIHFDLDLKGSAHAEHARNFDRERKRLMRFSEVRYFCI